MWYRLFRALFFRKRPLCEACGIRPARPGDPFCSPECAGTYYLYS